jgi:hypothetical protein
MKYVYGFGALLNVVLFLCSVGEAQTQHLIAGYGCAILLAMELK